MVPKSKTKKKTNKSIKTRTAEFIEKNDGVEEQGLNETAKNVNNSQETIVIIRLYEEIIKTQIKKAIGYIGKQGEVLKKFKNTENFFENIGQSRSTVCFNISPYKLLKKYPLLKTST